MRDRLLLDAMLEPTTDTERAEWGRMWAAEVYRVAPDGEIVASFAPAWADDLNSPRWDPDNFPLTPMITTLPDRPRP